MNQHKSYERSGQETQIIYVDWPMARWSRNISLKRGDPVLPYRSERRLVPVAPGYPDGGAAA